MSSKLKFIWIDDRPDRVTESKNLQTRLKISCRFENVKDKDLTGALNNILSGDEPDLILIDHKLEDVKSGIFKTGSTAAAYIREQWPECPIVSITAVDMNEVDNQQRSLYEEMYSISKISSYDDALLSIAKSFKKLKKARPQTIDELIRLLKAPKEERDRLKAILPKELKENFSNNSLVRDIYHWVKTTFLGRPGFLYDRIWAATLLGIKPDSFSAVEPLFSAAKYAGIFNDGSNERWWKSKLLFILSKQVADPGLPWEKGRKLPGITKTDYSKCYVTKEYFPETVAFVDETKNSKRVQIKLSQTISHPRYEDLLFFEEIRMMKPAE